MDRLIGIEQFGDEIDAVMKDRGIDRDEAAIVVAMRHGDLVGDVLFMGPLSEEEKRRRRMTLREVMVELGELNDESPDSQLLKASSPPRHQHRSAS